MRIGVYWIGRTRLAGVGPLTEEYAQRLKHYCELDAREIRGGSARNARKPAGATPGMSAEEQHMIGRAGRARLLALHPGGRSWDSREFAAFIGKQRDQGAGELAFCVGGAEGFTGEFLRRASLALSLSPMTMPHELARVVLLEQIYRAFTILSNHPYPR